MARDRRTARAPRPTGVGRRRRRCRSSTPRASTGSTTRTSTCSGVSCRSGPRSAPGASPATRRSSSARSLSAIRVAREMALLPYSVRQVTQRKGGRRDRGDRDDRGLRDDRCRDDRRRRRPTRVADDVRRDRRDRARRGHGRAGRGRRGGDRRADRRGAVVKIVLREDVETLGKKGDLLDVADGYARNYLVPRGLAMKATKGVVAQSEAMRRNREAREVREREAAQELATRLIGSQPSRSRRAPARAASSSARSRPPTSPQRCWRPTGIELDRRKLTLAEPIREIGEVEVAARAPRRRRRRARHRGRRRLSDGSPPRLPPSLLRRDRMA